MSKYRIYELAKEFHTESKVIINILEKHDCKVANHMSSVGDTEKAMPEPWTLALPVYCRWLWAGRPGWWSICPMRINPIGLSSRWESPRTAVTIQAISLPLRKTLPCHLLRNWMQFCSSSPVRFCRCRRLIRLSRSMGLVKDGENYTILTDIQGMEDALGDMDFKVAGTTQGVTAIQMDIKIAGITREILSSALSQAKRGRAFILGKMLEVIDKPSEELSPYAPRMSSAGLKAAPKPAQAFRLRCTGEPPCTERYAQWCERAVFLFKESLLLAG